jgi:Luciferase-like monooxygenase
MDLETFDETVAKTDEDPFFSQRSGHLRFGCRPHRRVEDLGMEIFPPDQQMPEALRARQKAEIDKWWPLIRQRISKRNDLQAVRELEADVRLGGSSRRSPRPCWAVDLAAFIVLCEEAGFDGVGIHDHPSNGRDAYLALARACRTTQRLRLFPATSSPLVRHPLILASLTHSLDEIAPERMSREQEHVLNSCLLPSLQKADLERG